MARITKRRIKKQLKRQSKNKQGLCEINYKDPEIIKAILFYESLKK